MKDEVDNRIHDFSNEDLLRMQKSIFNMLVYPQIRNKRIFNKLKLNPQVLIEGLLEHPNGDSELSEFGKQEDDRPLSYIRSVFDNIEYRWPLEPGNEFCSMYQQWQYYDKYGKSHILYVSEMVGQGTVLFWKTVNSLPYRQVLNLNKMDIIELPIGGY